MTTDNNSNNDTSSITMITSLITTDISPILTDGDKVVIAHLACELAEYLGYPVGSGWKMRKLDHNITVRIIGET